jgi:hypothetical protein
MDSWMLIRGRPVLSNTIINLTQSYPKNLFAHWSPSEDRKLESWSIDMRTGMELNFLFKILMHLKLLRKCGIS